MSRRVAWGTLPVVVVAALLVAVASGPAHAAADVSVTVDRARIETRLGREFVFRSKIANDGTTAVSGLIAHLNLLSLRDGLYVDPEDWSARRTHYLRPIPAGGSTTVTWRLQAVNSGRLGAYVAVLPAGRTASRPTTGPTIHVTVAQRRTLNSSGILPLALGIPALLGLATLGLRLHRGG
jgi:hypothetical protein